MPLERIEIFVGTARLQIQIDTDALDGKYILGPNARYSDEPEVHCEELAGYYSPVDFGADATFNPRTSWNNLLVLGLNAIRIEKGQLQAVGCRPWSDFNPNGGRAPQHRLTHALQTPQDLSASLLPPIFPHLSDRTPVEPRDLDDWVDMVSWLNAIGAGDQTGYSPTYLAPFEIAALIHNGRSVTCGQMAAHGYFRWPDARFAPSLRRDLLPRPPSRVRVTEIERRFSARWARAQALLQYEAALAPFQGQGQGASGGGGSNPPRQTRAPAGIAQGSQPTPPTRTRLASRRVQLSTPERSVGEALHAASHTRAPPSPPAPGYNQRPVGDDQPSQGADLGPPPESQPAEPGFADKAWMLGAFGPPSLTRKESVEQFSTLLQLVIDAAAPANGVESLLVWEIATAEWEIRRLKRASGPAIEQAENVALLAVFGAVFENLDVIGRDHFQTHLKAFAGTNIEERAILEQELRRYGSSIAKVEQAGIVYALPSLRAIEAITASCVFRRNAAINLLRRGREPATHRLMLGVKILPSADIIAE